jgi:HlyD family secretion protein
VKVKIAAFPFQKYGMVDGQVAHLSADSTDTAGGRPEEVNPEGRLAVSSAYKTHIKLKQQERVAGGEALRLMPGMQVVAEIRLGTRSVLEYLLSPAQ